ncbi:hypothetical protein [Achromobacter xylosoxidans]|uniref:hypothetical protein n=1 Tax=Alcaligenes xylosoxydans xylosoxydans TaxID=85698 RepID=UPI001F141AC8|nr:hypothetical protein [Achromobacter xylosoxidans]
MGYINPLLRLRAGQALQQLPRADRERIAAVMRELRSQANTEAETAWRRRKAPMAAYWRAVSTYARHVAHALIAQSTNKDRAFAAPQASAERLVRYCPGCGSVGPVGDEYRDCCPDGGEARMIPAPLAEKCRDTFKIAVKALRADAAANEAMGNQVPAITEEHTLRAMARNYTDRHSWDKLDSKTITAAADEIRALRAALAARAQLPENGGGNGHAA